MSPRVDAIVNAALSLPLAERADVAEQLLASLQGPEQAEIERAWSVEIEKRIRDLDVGKIKTVPAEEVFRSLRARKKP
jgi:putative addiction module component (TIGR02574 family)